MTVNPATDPPFPSVSQCCSPERMSSTFSAVAVTGTKRPRPRVGTLSHVSAHNHGWGVCWVGNKAVCCVAYMMGGWADTSVPVCWTTAPVETSDRLNPADGTSQTAQSCFSHRENTSSGFSNVSEASFTATHHLLGTLNSKYIIFFWLFHVSLYLHEANSTSTAMSFIQVYFSRKFRVPVILMSVYSH